MPSTDPLLRAVQDGDPRCPDGDALKHLGATIRAATADPAQPSDLAPRVVTHLRAMNGLDADQAIDAFYDGDQPAHPELNALATLISVHSAPPRAVHLMPGITRKMKASTRLSARVSSLVRSATGTATLTGDGRRRIWWWVAAGHVAAALLLIVLRPVDVPATTKPEPRMLASVPQLEAWDQATAAVLFATRHDARQRAELLHYYGLDHAAPAIAGCAQWLVSTQLIGGEDDGRFGSAISAHDQALAIQASVILALLGEGDSDALRSAAIQRGLAWMQRQGPPSTSMSSCMVTWCWTEAAVQFRDAETTRIAEEHLNRLEPLTAGPMAAIGLLSLEMARAGGLRIPAQTLTETRRQITRPIGADRDPARLGSAALTRMILGLRDLDSTRIALDRLVTDSTNVIPDPLSWLLPTLAMREEGGDRWTWWKEHRIAPLLQSVRETAKGQRMVPAHQVRWASDVGGDVAATAWTVLVLQAPYRTVPLSIPSR